MLFLFLAACAAFTDVRTASDPLAGLAERFAADPEAAALEVAALPPAERVVALDVLTRAWPGRTQSLCALAPTEAAELHCSEVNGRPHLWTGPVTQDDPPHVPRAAAGPSRSVMPKAPTLPPAWTDAPPSGCAVGTASFSREECLEEVASTASNGADWAAAAGACAALSEGQWRDECFFQAAEIGVRSHGAAGYPAAARMCQRAGGFESRCHAHLLLGLHGDVAGAASAIESAWADHELVRRYLLDEFWSGYVTQVLRDLAPDPATEPPPIAMRHARLELALVVVVASSAEDDPAAPLDALATRVAGWEPTVWTSHHDIIPADAPMRANWSDDAPGEDTVPAMLLRARSRRAWSEDANVDRRICLLEAAAIVPQARTDLLRDGLDDEDAIVRWTAARLLAVFDSGDAALQARALSDPDARVRARAQFDAHRASPGEPPTPGGQPPTPGGPPPTPGSHPAPPGPAPR
ncbi:MAG: hypothetical protein Q8P18_02080 [Pseudomonadota bacterium]|nr:hypothetical protein [Pseudomonadota bacterium]